MKVFEIMDLDLSYLFGFGNCTYACGSRGLQTEATLWAKSDEGNKYQI